MKRTPRSKKGDMISLRHAPDAGMTPDLSNPSAEIWNPECELHPGSPWFHTRRLPYFACRVSIYVTRFATLCCTWLSCPWLMLENSGPQTGISWLPWDGVVACPRMMAATWAAGYFPPSFCARAVKSEGAVFIAEAAGPFPLASVPWQTAQ